MPRDRLLTDGFIGEASLWKLDPLYLEGEVKKDRLGELVIWAPGDAVTVTVDLGQTQMVGGARVSAIQPNETILYPAVMDVEVSLDGVDYAPAGRAKWEDVFFPPDDMLLWEGFDSPLYEHLPAGGMISYRFPILFNQPRQTRYVRFTLAPPETPEGMKEAGIGLYEVDVWDTIEKLPWDERLQMP